MKKTLGKRLLSGFTSVFLAAATFAQMNIPLGNQSVLLAKAANTLTSLNDDNETDDVTLLVGNNPTAPDGTAYPKFDSVGDAVKQYEKDYLLGIAGRFCIFLDGDFHEFGSDAEGRVAIKGNLTIDDIYNSYSMGKGDFATNVPLEKVLENDKYANTILGGEIKNGQLDDTYFDENGSNVTSHSDNSHRRLVFNKDSAEKETVKSSIDTNLLPQDSNGDWKKVNWSQTYVSNLIDFDEQFENFRKTSAKLANKKNPAAKVTIDGSTVTFDAGYSEGDTAEVVYFNVPYTDAETGTTITWDDIRKCTEFKFVNIPELPNGPRKVVETTKDHEIEKKDWNLSYIIINAGGENITVADNDVKTYINGTSISKGAQDKKNNDAGVTSLLYNYYEAEKVILGLNYQGTIFAPNADVVDKAEVLYGDDDDQKRGNDKVGVYGHLSGALVAKSFKGGTEFG